MIFTRLIVTKLIIALSLIMLQSVVVVQANTVLDKNTLQGMYSEEVEEFNRQYNLEYKKYKGDLSVWNALVHMLNPYSILIERHHYVESTREKLTKIEVNFLAKEERFSECQTRLAGFLGTSSSAHAVTAKGGMDKHDYLTSLAKRNDTTYPFTTISSNDSFDIMNQFFVKMVWKYRGKGKENVTTFFNACLSIPIKIFEDEYDTEIEDE